MKAMNLQRAKLTTDNVHGFSLINLKFLANYLSTNLL